MEVKFENTFPITEQLVRNFTSEIKELTKDMSDNEVTTVYMTFIKILEDSIIIELGEKEFNNIKKQIENICK